MVCSLGDIQGGEIKIFLVQGDTMKKLIGTIIFATAIAYAANYVKNIGVINIDTYNKKTSIQFLELDK